MRAGEYMRQQEAEVRGRLADWWCHWYRQGTGTYLTAKGADEATRRADQELDPPGRPRGKHEKPRQMSPSVENILAQMRGDT